MQNTAKKLNVSRENEEQLVRLPFSPCFGRFKIILTVAYSYLQFIALRDQVLQQDAAAVAAAQQYRRNSIVSSVFEGDSSGSYTV